MNIRDELLAVVDCLNKADLPYALCGGLALSLHGYIRVTKDIDLLVPAPYVPIIKKAVREVGFIVAAAEPMIFGHGTSREAIVHRVNKFEGEKHLMIDLLEVNNANRSAWKSRRLFRLHGRRVWAVSRRALIAMKKEAGRLQDLADVQALENRREDG